jgi:hypothetical protein
MARGAALKKSPAAGEDDTNPSSVDDLERAQLEASQRSGLQDEIDMMRASVRRAFELFNKLAWGSEDERPNLQEMTDVLGALGLASTRLSALLKSQAYLSTQSSDTMDLLSEALKIVEKDFDL